MFDKTFENLLKGLDPKNDLKSLHASSKKFDINTRIKHYAQDERDFLFLSNQIDSEMRAKVNLLNLPKSSIQPILNDAFIRKPKRQADKSTLSNEARTSFVELFDKMNEIWESSYSKRKVTQLFDIKVEGGDKDAQKAGENAEDRSGPRPRKSSQFKLSPRANLNTQAMGTMEDATSPLYVTKSSFAKNYGNFLTVEGNAEKSKKQQKLGENQEENDKKNTPNLKEDSLDTSHNFQFFKQPASLNQITASQDTLEQDDKEETNKELQRINNEEEEEKKRKKAEEEQRKKEANIQKKVDGYLKKIPDYGFLFSNEVVPKNQENS